MRIFSERLSIGFAVLALGIISLSAAGCSQKQISAGDIRGTNVPKLDPKMVRAKMADAMGKMAAAGGPKRIDPNH